MNPYATIEERDPDLVIGSESKGNKTEVYVLEEWESAKSKANSMTFRGPSVVTRTRRHGLREVESHISDPDFWNWLQAHVDERDLLRERLLDETADPDVLQSIRDEAFEEYHDLDNRPETVADQLRECSIKELLELRVNTRLLRAMSALGSHATDDDRLDGKLNDLYHRLDELHMDLNEVLREIGETVEA